jgi:HD superfamily phosphohydrolase
MGAMHLASRLLDSVAARAGLPPDTHQRFRAAVRLAVLCHDLGHMPLSHAAEQIAPARSALRLPAWLGGSDGQASHEDFTAALVLQSSLRPVLEREFGALGITPESVVGLVSGATPPGGWDFRHQGVDWSPLLRAIVSGELDADRMDYLLRDSFYTGVNYGRYDLDWIVQNLSGAEKDGKMFLALSRSAAFAFEDFLLSRYHMFVSVYYHHTSVSFDYMLGRYYREAPGEFEIPADPEKFLFCDDVALASTLRASKSPWAQRIVLRQGFKLLAQFTERDEGYDLPAIIRALTAAGVEHFEVESHGVLSKYFGEGAGPSLYIHDSSTGRLTEVAKYTPLYQRYSSAVRLSRIYVRPDQAPAARAQFDRLVRR